MSGSSIIRLCDRFPEPPKGWEAEAYERACLTGRELLITHDESVCASKAPTSPSLLRRRATIGAELPNVYERSDLDNGEGSPCAAGPLRLDQPGSEGVEPRNAALLCPKAPFDNDVGDGCSSTMADDEQSCTDDGSETLVADNASIDEAALEAQRHRINEVFFMTRAPSNESVVTFSSFERYARRFHPPLPSERPPPLELEPDPIFDRFPRWLQWLRIPKSRAIQEVFGPDIPPLPTRRQRPTR